MKSQAGVVNKACFLDRQCSWSHRASHRAGSMLGVNGLCHHSEIHNSVFESEIFLVRTRGIVAHAQKALSLASCAVPRLITSHHPDGISVCLSTCNTAFCLFPFACWLLPLSFLVDWAYVWKWFGLATCVHRILVRHMKVLPCPGPSLLWHDIKPQKSGSKEVFQHHCVPPEGCRIHLFPYILGSWGCLDFLCGIFFPIKTSTFESLPSTDLTFLPCIKLRSLRIILNPTSLSKRILSSQTFVSIPLLSASSRNVALKVLKIKLWTSFEGA